MANPGYRILPHTAEIIVAIQGRTWAEFYQNAARGLLKVYDPQRPPKKEQSRKQLLCADSPEELLVAWLNELVFLVSARRWLPTRVKVLRAEETRIDTVVTGGFMNSNRSRTQSNRTRTAKAMAGHSREAPCVSKEIKSATFGDLKIRRARGLWRAQIILDV